VRKRENPLKAYLINLDRSADRLAHMHEEFSRAGVDFERIAAVDGAALNPSEMKEFRQARSAARPEGWLLGEVGCFLSHMDAWRRIASSAGDEWAAVFEDDIRVSPDLGSLLASTGWLPADADIVRLEAYGSMRLSGGRSISEAAGRKLYRARSGTAGAAGYIVARSACLWLIETPPHEQTFLDVFLFKPRASEVARRLRRYQVVPALCIQESILQGGETGLKSLIKSRNTRGRGYREQSNPFLRLWPIRRIAVPFRL
jgi:glycosyl transferase family 25